jgi:predicted transcriptional regulator
MTTGEPPWESGDTPINQRPDIIHNFLLLALYVLFIGFCILEFVYIPLFGADGTGVPVPRWQMSPPDLICHIFHYLSPALVMPIQFLFFSGIGFGIYLGFRTISGKSVLDNTTRTQIFNTIWENPGIHFNALRRKTGINRGTLRYHLSVLSRYNKIACIRDGIFSRYLPRKLVMSGYDCIVACRYQNGTDRKIISYLRCHLDTSQRDIADAMGIAPSTVNGRIARLHEEKIITIEHMGRGTQVALTREAVEVIQRIENTEITSANEYTNVHEIPG